MRRLFATLALVAMAVVSCGGYGGKDSPSGGGYPAGTPTAPSAKPVSSPLPSGNPNVDNYGY